MRGARVLAAEEVIPLQTTKRRREYRAWRGWVRLPALALVLFHSAAIAQLNENCIVSVLNRNTQVRPDGTWLLPNIPANFGAVRARATCLENGTTLSGQSAFFTIPTNGSVDVPPIVLGPVTPIPTQLVVSGAPTMLTQVDQTVQLTVTGIYADGTQANLTNANSGTQYLISNANLATITANGLLTAKASGTVLVQAINEGTQGLLQFMIALSADSDGDGILDDIELANGLNPNNPADALDDADRDGLNNRDELQRGTAIQNPDTDGDTLADGEEVNPGQDGFITNPLLSDTDGDGVPDNVEVASVSDPTDPSSVNLALALTGITVIPPDFLINVNSIEGEGFQQLTVTGEFILGGTINLTARARGTDYASSDLLVCNFGAEDGRVFGGQDGTCTITVTNNGFTAMANATVVGFTPIAISQIAISGYANNVDAAGDFAFVAAGATGLQVVGVSNPEFPQIVGEADTPGNANDIRIVGGLAFIADGNFGLRILDVSNPANPLNVGSVDTTGEAVDVMVVGNRAYIADSLSGLAIVNVTNPANPTILGTVDTPGTARGVDVLQMGNSFYAVIADDSPSPGLRVIDVTNPATASIVGNLVLSGSPKDLRINGNLAYVAAFTGGMQIVDLTIPQSPIARGSLPSQFVPRDVEVAGRFALFAEQLFPNAVPVVDVTDPQNPILRTTINFSGLGDYAGTGIAVAGPFLYMTGESFIVGPENGTVGNTRLFIGQFLPQADLAGVPPQVSMISPADGATAIQGSTVSLRANASDDIAVGAVTFVVNGVDVFTDNSAPYEALYTIPNNATNLTILARATDLGNNVGTSAPVEISAIPDPGTTISGRVVREDTLSPVTGAAVMCVNLNVISTADGTFTINNAPTVAGDISCQATFLDAATNMTLRGFSAALPPVAGGVTAIGDLFIREGGRLLLLTDVITPGTTALADALAAAGNDVTVRPPPEFTWDGTNPPINDFDCVVHLDGTTYGSAQPASGQQALVNFVNLGGGYITSQWMGYERTTGLTTGMNDLILFGWGGGDGGENCGGCITTYVKVQSQSSHPVLNGVADNFTFAADGNSAGQLFGFAGNQPVVLMTQAASGRPAVAIREVGLGRTVQFSVAPNYLGQGQELLVADIQRLYANAAAWACR